MDSDATCQTCSCSTGGGGRGVATETANGRSQLLAGAANSSRSCCCNSSGVREGGGKQPFRLRKVTAEARPSWLRAGGELLKEKQQILTFKWTPATLNSRSGTARGQRCCLERLQSQVLQAGRRRRRTAALISFIPACRIHPFGTTQIT